MKLLVHILQPCFRHMRINLRRGYIRMAEHFLHRSKISPVLKQMGRKGMPEGMRGQLFFYPRFQCDFL